jgi:hypothetical protein
VSEGVVDLAAVPAEDLILRANNNPAVFTEEEAAAKALGQVVAAEH